jgi:ABC-type sugar transport system ATPase subunit
MAAGPAHAVIGARGLTKHYGNVQAVKSVEFDVNKGEIFGFFGPNGAGKTTTIRLLCGLTAPTSGTATVCGLDVKTEPTRVRRQLGIVQEEEVFYEKMTPAASNVSAGIPCRLRIRRREAAAGEVPVAETKVEPRRVAAEAVAEKVTVVRTPRVVRPWPA